MMPERTPLKIIEATTTAGIASYMRPIGKPSRSPLTKSCAECKKLGHTCPDCEEP